MQFDETTVAQKEATSTDIECSVTNPDDLGSFVSAQWSKVRTLIYSVSRTERAILDLIGTTYSHYIF